jgi:hypothetical protein
VKLTFHRVLAVAPAVAWPLLTIPEQMNRWSLAKVSAIEPGRGGRHDAVGAKRIVRVPAFGLSATLHEDIVEAAPYERFVYRVTGGAGVRNHRGTIALGVHAQGTALLWQVEFEGALPGIERLLGAILRPRLAKSLDRLVAISAAEA